MAWTRWPPWPTGPSMCRRLWCGGNDESGPPCRWSAAGPAAQRTGFVLSVGLAGPVDVALAQASDRVPGPRALPGGSRYEPKWDGFRCSVVGHPDGIRLWSKNGTDLTSRFPELAGAAAAVVPEDTVIDGEAVIFHDDRLSFELLQRRFTSSRSQLTGEARQHPPRWWSARWSAC